MSKSNNWFSRLLKKNIIVEDNKNAVVAIATGENASINFYQSADYKALQSQLEKARQRVKKYPDDTEFWQDLETQQQKLEDFKRDVLKLAEDINKIPINTERLRKAKQYFEAGDYKAARDILDAAEIKLEQDALLAKDQRLDATYQREKNEVKIQLENNATESLLKARLTAIDYSLPDRIAQTCHFFEQALQSARTPENIFAYAYFLQENNQFSAAEDLYQEGLGIYRQLAKDNPAVYLPDVAMTLNNLGNLVKADSGRRSEAEKLYQEGLGIYRQLAKDNPAVYLPNVATTLNNLGVLVSDDSRRRSEAEKLYQEALGIYRQLAKDNPAVYLPDVAMTLNNLGNLVQADSGRRSEAEALYQEGLGIYRQLAKDNPAVYLPYVAGTLNNLGVLVADDSGRRSEAEVLYQEGLGIYRQLAQDNPAVYLPAVANTLYAFGSAHLDWQEPQTARVCLQESATLFEPFAKQAPTVFGDKYATILKLIEQTKR